MLLSLSVQNIVVLVFVKGVFGHIGEEITSANTNVNDKSQKLTYYIVYKNVFVSSHIDQFNHTGQQKNFL